MNIYNEGILHFKGQDSLLVLKIWKSLSSSSTTLSQRWVSPPAVHGAQNLQSRHGSYPDCFIHLLSDKALSLNLLI